MNEPIPHFSTISYNFKHRYTEQTIEEIFYWILKGDPKMTEKVKKDAKDLNNNRRVLLITAILALIVMLTYTISLFVGGDFKAFTQAAAPWLIMGIGVAALGSYSPQTQDNSKKCFFLTFGSMHSIISYTNHTNYTEMII